MKVSLSALTVSGFYFTNILLSTVFKNILLILEVHYKCTFNMIKCITF